MNALLLIAHGSRRLASNDEVRNLSHELSQKLKDEFSIIEYAFLELAEPSIQDGVAACIQKGVGSVTILPYFLSADIPAELEKAQQLYPQLQIKMAPYLGSAKGITDILMLLSKQAS